MIRRVAVAWALVASVALVACGVRDSSDDDVAPAATAGHASGGAPGGAAGTSNGGAGIAGGAGMLGGAAGAAGMAGMAGQAGAPLQAGAAGAAGSVGGAAGSAGSGGAAASAGGASAAGSAGQAAGAAGAAVSSGVCEYKFGKSITATYGRLDGTLVAVVSPLTPACGHDDNHTVLQIRANGETYKLWVNVGTLGQPSEVFFAEKDAPLFGEPFAEGWHTGVKLDYVTNLSVHATDFSLKTTEEHSTTLVARLTVGAPVSVYATGFASADGAHDVHRYLPDQDGSVVAQPTTKPHHLLFRFANQMF